MKKIHIPFLFTLILLGCSQSFSDKLENVKWQAGGENVVRFSDNKVFSCVASEGKWDELSQYSVKENILTLHRSDDEDNQAAKIKFTGEGKSRKMIVTTTNNLGKTEEEVFKIQMSKTICVVTPKNNGRMRKRN